MENLLNTRHQIDALSLSKSLPDNSIDCICTDPPFLTTREAWDKNEVFNQELVDEFFRVLKPTGNIYVWCGIGEKSQSLLRWFPLLNKDLTFKDLITWKKRRGIGMRKGWLYTREEILWFVKDNTQFTWNKAHQYNQNEANEFTEGFSGYKCLSEFKRYTNVWTDIPEFLGDKKCSHYTPKPEAALERIILVSTQEGEVVFDPFAGSFSVAKVCDRLKRNWICGDINIYEDN